ncbi:MAG: hypothetical protein ABI461_03505, partial [Polyangiaceae bacterium]
MIDSALASLHGANLAAASNVPLGGFLATGMLKFASLGATGLGLFLTMWSLVSDQSGPAWRYYARYCSALERRLRLQFIWTKGSQIFLGQIGARVVEQAHHLLGSGARGGHQPDRAGTHHVGEAEGNPR